MIIASQLFNKVKNNAVSLLKINLFFFILVALIVFIAMRIYIDFYALGIDHCYNKFNAANKKDKIFYLKEELVKPIDRVDIMELMRHLKTSKPKLYKICLTYIYCFDHIYANHAHILIPKPGITTKINGMLPSLFYLEPAMNKTLEIRPTVLVKRDFVVPCALRSDMSAFYVFLADDYFAYKMFFGKDANIAYNAITSLLNFVAVV